MSACSYQQDFVIMQQLASRIIQCCHKLSACRMFSLITWRMSADFMECFASCRAFSLRKNIFTLISCSKFYPSRNFKKCGSVSISAGVGDYRRIKTTQRQIFLTSWTSGIDNDFYPKDGLCYFTNGSKIWNSVTMEAAVWLFACLNSMIQLQGPENCEIWDSHCATYKYNCLPEWHDCSYLPKGHRNLMIVATGPSEALVHLYRTIRHCIAADKNIWFRR
jgi:hypothetical protein